MHHPILYTQFYCSLRETQISSDNATACSTGALTVRIAREPTLVYLIEDRSLIRDRGGFSEALHWHLMLPTGFLIRARGVTGHLMLATGFVIRDRVVTEGETSTQAWKA